MSKCLIHYFSGTGNTYHMVKNMEKEIISRGHEVNLVNVEKDNEKKLSEYELHIFCFPVYGFGVPSIMIKYINNLNIIKSRAAIVCTSAGIEGQALSYSKYLLSKKGLDVFLTDMIIYTYNWTQLFNPSGKENEEKVFNAAETKILKIVNMINNNERSFLKRNFMFLTLSWIIFLGFSKIGRRILGKSYIADSACINCGKCKEICPKKVIQLYNGRPYWNINCEGCQRCINMCPKRSIQLSLAKLCVFIVFELAPIFLLMHNNKYYIHLPTILNLILYFLMFVLFTILANFFISILEKFNMLKKLFEISYTKKYRRNIAKGFKIDSRN